MNEQEIAIVILNIVWMLIMTILLIREVIKTHARIDKEREEQKRLLDEIKKKYDETCEIDNVNYVDFLMKELRKHEKSRD